MLRHLPDRGRSGSRPSGIAGAAILGADLVEHPLKKDIDKDPRAHIARLFLAPHDLGFLEARQLRHQRLGWKRIELLDTQEINVIDAALLALLIEVVIDLARADYDAADVGIGNELDLLARHKLRIVPQQAMERSARPHIVELRNCPLVSQQRLRRHQDEGLSEIALELTAQDVKV